MPQPKAGAPTLYTTVHFKSEGVQFKRLIVNALLPMRNVTLLRGLKYYFLCPLPLYFSLDMATCDQKQVQLICKVCTSLLLHIICKVMSCQFEIVILVTTSFLSFTLFFSLFYISFPLFFFLSYTLYLSITMIYPLPLFIYRSLSFLYLLLMCGRVEQKRLILKYIFEFRLNLVI